MGQVIHIRVHVTDIYRKCVRWPKEVASKPLKRFDAIGLLLSSYLDQCLAAVQKQWEEQQVNCDSDNSTGFRRSEAAMGGVSSRIFNKEEGVCGFCVFMKGGPCRDPFIAWDHCLLEAETSNEDAVDKCAEVTRTLHKCMQAHPEYYELDGRARKAAEEKAKEEMEKENVAKGAEKTVAMKISDTAEKKMDEKAVKEVGSNAADKEMEKETALQKNRN